MKGTSIITFTGKSFDYKFPQQESICLEDIAHHLALINRYTGATRVPYSVAEHSVRMSYLTTGTPIVNLLHDSAEAYLNDITSPVKIGLGWISDSDYEFDSYRNVESRVLRVIGEALGFRDLYANVLHKDIKIADRIMMATEVRDLMPEGTANTSEFIYYLENVESDHQRIKPWPWDIAEYEFIARFKELTHANH